MVIVQKKPRKKHSWMLKSVTTFAGTATPNTYLGSLILDFFYLKSYGLSRLPLQKIVIQCTRQIYL